MASIMAAGSFVGEKEKRTLETLLYSPLSITKIFQAKVLASFLLSMFISFISFVFLINAGLLLLLGIVLMVLATFLMKEAAKGFQYEKILQ
ncbi:MAG TPA: ABC transporter permease subunit [Candidatus Dorea intestinavium]|nr:ABC transporter permease subunit [Candidatus Dorea intestinavium]